VLYVTPSPYRPTLWLISSSSSWYCHLKCHCYKLN